MGGKINVVRILFLAYHILPESIDVLPLRYRFAIFNVRTVYSTVYAFSLHRFVFTLSYSCDVRRS